MKIKSKKITEILSNPSTSEGERHNEALKLAFYLIGEGNSPESVRELLIRNYPAIAKRSSKEIEDIVDGAVRKGPKPTTGRESEHTPFYKKAATTYMTPLKVAHSEASELPEPLPDPTLTMFKTLFKEGDFIAITNTAIQNEEGKWNISCRGGTLSYEDAIKRIKTTIKNLDSPQGAWMRCNPIKKGGASDKDITDFRHCLVEFDSIPIQRQYAVLKASNLPISTLTHSGGKSLHALVRVDATNKEEFDARVEKIYSFLAAEGVDKSNRNPSNWTRLAGVVRDGKPQSLLGVSLGASTFDSWLADMDVEELPEEVKIEDLEAFDRTNDPNNILGNRWICKSGTILLQAQSGIGKSTLATQAAISWAVGRDLFGIRAVKPLRVSIIQAENDLGDLAEQFQDSVRAMSLTTSELSLLKINLRFFMEQVRTGEEFIRMTRNIVRKTKADLVIADPLLAYIGGDVSKSEVVAKFLRNGLNAVLKETGAVWMWIHHMGKPKEAKEGQTTSDLAYSGLGSSDLTNWARETVTLVRDPAVEHMQFDLILSKRGKRAGLTDVNGNIVSKIKIKHSDSGVTWERVKSHKLAKGKPPANYSAITAMPNLSKDDALKWIAQMCQVPEDEAFKALKSFHERGHIAYYPETQTYKGKS